MQCTFTRCSNLQCWFHQSWGRNSGELDLLGHHLGFAAWSGRPSLLMPEMTMPRVLCLMCKYIEHLSFKLLDDSERHALSLKHQQHGPKGGK